MEILLTDDFLNEIEPLKADESSDSLKEQAKQPTREEKNAPKKHHDKKKAKGGYRPALVDQIDLGTESIELTQDMKILIDNMSSLCDQDVVSLYLLIYLNKRYPNNFLESSNKIIDSNHSKFAKTQSRSRRIGDFNIKWRNNKLAKRLNDHLTLFEFVNSFNLHSVPQSARFSLASWYLEDNFKLVLFVNKIPTPREVLEMQANAQRCVTIIFDRLDRLVLGERDPLSFMLHDLVHAYKMFHNEYLLKGQIGFSKAISNLLNDVTGAKLINELNESNKDFAHQFDYLISDMNSHWKHLFHYFKATLINAFKAKYKLTTDLSGQSLEHFERTFEAILDILKMNESEKNVAKSILNENSLFDQKNFALDDFYLLENYFIKLSVS
jgi:hypothetical protein